jgi:plastocyanin
LQLLSFNSYYYNTFVLLLLISIFLYFFLCDLEYDNNYFIYAQKEDNKNNNNATGIHIITIPKGSANPSIDVTNLEKREWYVPSKIEIESGDVVKWINNDRESHTVTSGLGSGIQSLLTNQLGTPNNIFDSGLFLPGESWSYNFTNKIGAFTYFCTLHPWMTGVVDVKETQRVQQQQQQQQQENRINPIPEYPVDDEGNKLDRFPVHTLSNDEKFDIDMSWSPKVLQTDETSTFILNFFEMPSNEKLHLLPFDIEILQNNQTLEKASGITEIGSGTFQYRFAEPGPITVRIDNVGNTPAFTEFTTLVYQNPNTTSSQLTDNTNNNQDSNLVVAPVSQFSNSLISPLFLVSLTYAIIIALPVAAGAIIVLYKKGII